MSVSGEKPRPGSSEAWTRGVEADDGSFPPVAEFGLRGGDSGLAEMDDTDDPRALERQRALMSPAAKERRARFAKYVGGAMVVSLLLCAAAVVKTSLPAASTEPAAFGAPAPTPLAHAAPPERVASPPERVASPPERVETPALPVPVAANAVVEPQASSSATAPVPSQAPPAAALPAQGAAKEREASRFALERGDLGGAVAAGERSVALDPTDGEAWLVLGAAYQARGEFAQARRCYRSCVEQGTRGPKAECRAMAQGE